VKNIWFEVENDYKKFLAYERSDAFLIGLIPVAMRTCQDITCTTPVTEELLYQIETYLIPSLVKQSKSLYATKIYSQTAPALPRANGVGTGCSCGVDSMHVIANYYKPKYPHLKLTHLCINSVGSFNECYGGPEEREKVKSICIEKSLEVARELDLPIIITNSNFYEVIPQVHLYTHTYSSVFAIYALQKLWKVYFYGSSGYDFSMFSLQDSENISCAHYELLSLDCFSLRNFKIYSEGGEKTRYEKVDFIKDFPLAQKYLHVCTTKPSNCGVCPKCMRTILTLYSMNKLSNFKSVFDVNYFEKNKADYLQWLYRQHKNNDEMNEATYQSLINDPQLKDIEREDHKAVNLPASGDKDDKTKSPIFNKLLTTMKSAYRKTLTLVRLLHKKGIRYSINYTISKIKHQ
jgi:bacterioferritin-associated ferredoxin